MQEFTKKVPPQDAKDAKYVWHDACYGSMKGSFTNAVCDIGLFGGIVGLGNLSDMPEAALFLGKAYGDAAIAVTSFVGEKTTQAVVGVATAGEKIVSSVGNATIHAARTVGRGASGLWNWAMGRN